jgi:tetratricopeptide (TPR) repeat protein
MREAELSTRRSLAAELLSLKKCDAYGALGISPAATDAEIEKAYATRARRYHGDLHRHLPAECREMAREAFELLHQAYRQVATGGKRQRYNSRLSTMEMEAVSRSGGRSLKAEDYKSRAEILIQADEWEKAAKELEQATELCGEAGDLWALRGWATYRKAPTHNGTVRQALHFLRRAVELDPHVGRSYLYLGWIYRETGRGILAEKQFEKAVQCDPNCAEALVELSLEKKKRSQADPGSKKF